MRDFRRLQTHFTSQEVLVRFLDSNSWTREVLPPCELQPFYWAMGLVPPLEHAVLPDICGATKLGSLSAAIHARISAAISSSSWWPASVPGSSGILERLLLGRQIYDQKDQLLLTFTPIQRTIWEHVEQYLMCGSQKDLLRVFRLLHSRGKHQMKAFAERHTRNLVSLEGVMQRLQSEVAVVCDLTGCCLDMPSKDREECAEGVCCHGHHHLPHHSGPVCPALAWSSWPLGRQSTKPTHTNDSLSVLEHFDGSTSKAIHPFPLCTGVLPVLL